MDQQSLSNKTSAFVLLSSPQNLSPSVTNVLPTVNLNEMFQQQTLFPLSPKSLLTNTEASLSNQSLKSNTNISSEVFTAPPFSPLQMTSSSDKILQQPFVQSHEFSKLTNVSTAFTNLLLPPPPPPPPLPLTSSSMCLPFGSKFLFIFYNLI